MNNQFIPNSHETFNRQEHARLIKAASDLRKLREIFPEAREPEPKEEEWNTIGNRVPRPSFATAALIAILTIVIATQIAALATT